MDRNRLLMLIGIPIAVVGGGLLLFYQLFPTTNPAPIKTQENQVTLDQIASRYVEYRKDRLESAANKRRVLFFYASWCPVCKPADESFKANILKIPEDVVVIRVNYKDTETDVEELALSEKYLVTYQHTFVEIDSKGEVVQKWNGGEIDELVEKLK